MSIPMPRQSLPSNLHLPGLSHDVGGGIGPFQPGLGGVATSAYPLPFVETHEREVDYRMTATVPCGVAVSTEETIKDSGPDQLLFGCTPNLRHGSFAGPQSGLIDHVKKVSMVYVMSLSRLNYFLYSQPGRTQYRGRNAKDLFADWKVMGTQVDEESQSETWREFYVALRNRMYNYWNINHQQPRDRQYMWLVMVKWTDQKVRNKWDIFATDGDDSDVLFAPRKDLDLSAMNTALSQTPPTPVSAKSTGSSTQETLRTEVRTLIDQVANVMTAHEVGKSIVSKRIVELKEEQKGVLIGTPQATALAAKLDNHRRAQDAHDIAVAHPNYIASLFDAIRTLRGFQSIQMESQADFYRRIDRIVGRRVAMRQAAAAAVEEAKLKRRQVDRSYWQLVPVTTNTRRPPRAADYITDGCIGRYIYIGCRSSILQGNPRKVDEHTANAIKGTFPRDSSTGFFLNLRQIPVVEVFIGHC